MGFMSDNHKQFKKIEPDAQNEIKSRFLQASFLNQETILHQSSSGNTFFQGRQEEVSDHLRHQLHQVFVQFAAATRVRCKV